MKDYVVLTEADGNITFKRGNLSIALPSEDACYKRLVKLVEDAGGDVKDPSIDKFWKERHDAMMDPDQMKSAWAQACYDRLFEQWDKLYTPPAPVADNPTIDIFENFETPLDCPLCGPSADGCLCQGGCTVASCKDCGTTCAFKTKEALAFQLCSECYEKKNKQYLALLGYSAKPVQDIFGGFNL